MFEHSNNTAASMMEPECDAFPSYLRVLPDLRVVLCTTHGCCYTRQWLSRHLLEQHRLKGRRRQRIESSSRLNDIATSNTDVVQPQDGTNEIRGLPTVLGFLCHLPDCDFRSTSSDRIRMHYNKVHQWKVLHQGAMPWNEAYVQTLFQQTQSQHYFAVVLADQAHPSATPQYIYPRANAPNNAAPASTRNDVQSSPPTVTDNELDQMMREYHADLQQEQDCVETARDVSEHTPWMKRTGIYAHLLGLERDELGPSCYLPGVQEEPSLFLICESIGRVLEKAMNALTHNRNKIAQTLRRHEARLLNTFTRREISPLDYITQLQNPKSLQTYIETWQRLICYWHRVVEQSHLRDTLFQPSDRQLEAWCKATDAASELASPTDPDRDEAFRDRLDRAVLEFSLAIIQHSVPRRKFDSVLVSYAAVRFWSHKQGSWMPVRNYTSILSQLIYDCQMVVLAQVLAMAGDNDNADIGAMIVDIRDQWLLNDTDGPVVELLENWVLSFRIGQTEVQPPQIHWRADGETLVWSDVILHLSDLHRIIFEGVADARRIFDEELCLSSRSSPACDIPGLDLRLLVDNWGDRKHGQSFLTDSRNAAYVDPLNDWVYSRVEKSQALYDTFWLETDANTCVVRADAVQQYEDAVQRFLRALMVPFFLGSGQQGRQTDFIGLKWRNTDYVPRNLFLLGGQMLFTLSNRKIRCQSNASRWPVRFVLPEVAQLVTQFLVLVQPFRTFLHSETPGFGTVSDYLWSRGPGPWEEDAMTRVVVDAGKLILGKHIHFQAWQQITMGIARRKFASAEANLLIEEDGDDEEPNPVLVSMADPLHWQAGYDPHPNYHVYGRPENSALTDAEFEGFRRVGRLWHQFVRDPIHFQPTLVQDVLNGTSVSVNAAIGSFTTPSKRRQDEEQESPIVRRVARRMAPARTWR